ncbi:MAG: hypothetical protein U0Q12_07065 [Vicinamibacterales bacterium]
MAEELESTSEAPPERPKTPPIESRFLFVDVAAARAKQLRRGAIVRLAGDGVEAREVPHKLERVAMKEVSRGLVEYSTTEWKGHQ